MKVWITRDRRTRYEDAIVIWSKIPKMDVDENPDSLEPSIVHYRTSDNSLCLLCQNYRYFEDSFGYIPEPGTCVEKELILK